MLKLWKHLTYKSDESRCLHECIIIDRTLFHDIMLMSDEVGIITNATFRIAILSIKAAVPFLFLLPNDATLTEITSYVIYMLSLTKV